MRVSGFLDSKQIAVVCSSLLQLMVHREDLVKGDGVDIVLDAKVRGAGRSLKVSESDGRVECRRWMLELAIFCLF